MKKFPISLSRILGLVRKEFIQLKRDRLTVAMLLGIPFMQMVLFGFAINSDPKLLSTAVIQADSGPLVRSYLTALENTGYFSFNYHLDRVEDVEELFLEGKILFAITIPEDFERALIRGERPEVLIEADATDPVVTARATSAAMQVNFLALNHDLKGPLAHLRPIPPPVELRIHRRYNPENITHYNTIPGLLGIILTMTTVMITAITLARERERGTLENLFAMPVHPFEVMSGKIIPFIMGASFQAFLVLVAARFIFEVPILGDLWLLSLALIIFITVNLSVGFTLSTIATNQLQAMQMGMFFFLPSILLSGFLFPFSGMPKWAQWIGEILPLTHFVRIVKSIFLKSAEFGDIKMHLLNLLIILVITATISLKRYKATLD